MTGLVALVGAGACGLILVGCTGSISGDGSGKQPGPGGTNPGPGGTNPGPNPGPGPVNPPTPVAPAGVTAAPAPLRRLNHEQYANTVRDLLGTTEKVSATALPADEAIADRFLSNVIRPVQGVDLDRYADVADSLARKAVTNLATLVPCPASMGDPCAQRFIETFGKRAYRRPLAPAEVERLKAVFVVGKGTTNDFGNGIRLVVQGMLQSVNFLYLFEYAPARDAGKVVAVDNYALASRLSYFFWNTMPDEGLFQAAEKGELSNAEQVGRQAARLVADARFRDTVLSFHSQLLELHELGSAEKDPMLFPIWNDALKAAMAEETRRFIDHVMREGDGKLETLLNAKFSFLTGPLYDIYGVTKPAAAQLNTWQKVELNPAQRAGVFTQAGVMAGLAKDDRTNFIGRGKLIREALLCYEVPPPPPGVDNEPAGIPPTADARTRSAMHAMKPDCAVCHKAFDELGFAFEAFDPIGRFRANIDSHGDITSTKALDGRVANGVELLQKMSTADEVRECFAKQWLRFALGQEESPEHAQSLATALKTFKESGGRVPDMLVALARSDAFRHQKVRP